MGESKLKELLSYLLSDLLSDVVCLVVVIAFLLTMFGWLIWSVKWVLSLLFGI